MPIEALIVAFIIVCTIALIIVSALNRNGDDMGLLRWYWRVTDLESSMQTAPAQRAMPGPPPVQAQRPPSQQPQPLGRQAPPNKPAKAFVEIQRDQQGYHVECSINGAKFTAIVDTGATNGNIDTAIACRIGLIKRGMFGLSHNLTHNTNSSLADGSIRKGCAMPLDWVIGGKLTAKGVRTTVPLEAEAGGALLGLAALNQFDVEIKNNVLRISEK